MIFLLQAGGMREDIPELSVYLEVKAEGDKSRLRKRGMLEGVVEQGYRKARPLRIKLDCLNLNLNLVQGPTHRKNA